MTDHLVGGIGTESPGNYKPGGFHPVHLGDTFSNGRYTVVRKLGHGASSTIWLVSDDQTNTYVALKIVAASKTSSELAVLQHLEATYDPAEEGSQHIARMLDHFVHEGPNGRHQCIVGEVLGSNFSSSSLEWLYSFWDSGRFPSDLAHRLCGQLALAIAYLHKRGVAHGDIHPGNILLSIPDPLKTVEDLIRVFGRADSHKYTIRVGGHGLNGPVAPSIPHRPDYLLAGVVDCPELLRDCLRQPHIKLCDFSESYIPTLPLPPRLATPNSFRPPDAILANPPHASRALDMWALGAALYYLLSTCEFFYEDGDDRLLTSIALKLGPFPEPYWSQWERRAEFFTEDGEPLRTDWNREFLFAVEHVLPPGSERRGSFEVLLRALLCYDASKRGKASDVLESIWFQQHCRQFMGPGERYDIEIANGIIVA
ncbi:Protein kinase [Mycena kentingensis (nom. inval.)]|nr:Protein kinase [Mycena kentingensis (nom. inval.)]